MNINTIIDELIALISADSYFNDVKIMYSFPSSFKPTRIKNIFITLAIQEIIINSCQLDRSARDAEIKIKINIYTPLELNSKALCEIFTRLCACLNRYNVLSIKASEIAIDNDIQAYNLNTVITLGGELDFGGNDYEQ